ncbi:cell division cycle-associated protein 4-like isoform X2 [Clupea harengus]|nr:cell division cycle-associated protein 4-like isoform X2 [Clupea harengus]XP_031436243.1 cell division cycle-associated protein 4-like isoform X2 [Clupea harengus]
MFQKGTKRKFADAGSEEEEEEEAALRSAGVGPLPGEDPVSLRMLSSYSLQRQTLLNMSLVKLQLCHMLVEPNLCRSVLIANTVRHIQEEMTYDLTWQVGAAADALSHAHTQAECLATSDLLCRSALTEEEPEQQPATPFNAVGYSEEDEDGEEEDVVVDEDGDVPLSSVASPAPFLPGKLGMSLGVGMGLGPRWQGEPMCDPEEMDGADEFGKGSGDGSADDEDEDEDVAEYDRTEAEEEDGDRLAKTTEQIFSPLFETNRPTPVPEAALEELFSDVEASYYDLDSMLTGMQGAGAGGGGVCGGGGGGSGGSVPRTGPYELLESLSSSHTQTHSQPPLNPSTGCRPDLSELDHIMEIIVGS